MENSHSDRGIDIALIIHIYIFKFLDTNSIYNDCFFD